PMRGAVVGGVRKLEGCPCHYVASGDARTGNGNGRPVHFAGSGGRLNQANFNVREWRSKNPAQSLNHKAEGGDFTPDQPEFFLHNGTAVAVPNQGVVGLIPMYVRGAGGDGERVGVADAAYFVPIFPTSKVSCCGICPEPYIPIDQTVFGTAHSR